MCFSTQEDTLKDVVIRSSILFQVALAGKKLAVNVMSESEDTPLPDNANARGADYISFHKLEHTAVAAVVCVSATHHMQESSALWTRLGRAAMDVINEQNRISILTPSATTSRLHTLIVDDWGLAAEVSARTAFLKGLASQFQPHISVQNVEIIEPPC
jgi:hypothetical protein